MAKIVKASQNILLILLLLTGGSAFAQNQVITEPQLFYTKRIQLGAHLNSAVRGGINFKYGWHQTGKKKRILDTELAYVRHPKETNIYGASQTPQEYSFGKLNSVFMLRTGYGQTFLITERPYKNAVGLNFNYSIGLATALLKPVYLDILNISNDQTRAFVRAERYDPDVHIYQNLIYGNSSFFEGIGNTQARFGGYGKASLAVEWGAYPDEFHTLEAGVSLDVFPTGLSMVAREQTRSIVLFFIGYSFGWNK